MYVAFLDYHLLLTFSKELFCRLKISKLIPSLCPLSVNLTVPVKPLRLT